MGTGVDLENVIWGYFSAAKINNIGIFFAGGSLI
jgi:hypothetical protein